MKAINQKIVGYSVVKEESSVVAPLEQMHEHIHRPDALRGTTYKIKSPLYDHAFYITINDIRLNGGTEHESYRPFEIFINSKDMTQFQWIVALTRVISAVFRKGGEVEFLVEELQSVFDPKGGYFKKGGRFMPSLVAEIGSVIERHLIANGLLVKPELDDHQQRLIAEKRAQYDSIESTTSEFPESALLCAKCQVKAVIMSDGCAVCLNCSDSRCH